MASERRRCSTLSASQLLAATLCMACCLGVAHGGEASFVARQRTEESGEQRALFGLPFSLPWQQQAQDVLCAEGEHVALKSVRSHRYLNEPSKVDGAGVLQGWKQTWKVVKVDGGSVMLTSDRSGKYLQVAAAEGRDHGEQVVAATTKDAGSVWLVRDVGGASTKTVVLRNNRSQFYLTVDIGRVKYCDPVEQRNANGEGAQWEVECLKNPVDDEFGRVCEELADTTLRKEEGAGAPTSAVDRTPASQDEDAFGDEADEVTAAKKRAREQQEERESPEGKALARAKARQDELKKAEELATAQKRGEEAARSNAKADAKALAEAEIEERRRYDKELMKTREHKSLREEMQEELAREREQALQMNSASVGTPAPTNAAAIYNCDDGYEDWQARWTSAKKEFCCRTRHLGCTAPEPFDCDADYEQRTASWSLEKKVWCCKHESKGCEEVEIKVGDQGSLCSCYNVPSDFEDKLWCQAPNGKCRPLSEDGLCEVDTVQCVNKGLFSLSLEDNHSRPAIVVPDQRSNEGSCEGVEESWGTCPDLPPCASDCVPRDCLWGSWAMWVRDSDSGLCTGLMTRKRKILQNNNVCGSPCSGAMVETRLDVNADLVSKCRRLPAEDCILGVWREWSECQFSHDQKYRVREVSQPSGGGLPCADGVTQETMPCSGHLSPQVCELSQWQSWTGCSSTCGRGQRSRSRRVIKQSRFSAPCEGTLMESEPCTYGECPAEDCKMGPWSEWSECSAVEFQRLRRRAVLVDAVGNGRPCNGSLTEAKGCRGKFTPRDCVVSSWEDWHLCDKTCGGGQMFRSRYVTSPAQNYGKCTTTTLRQTRPCHTEPCWAVDAVQDCVFEVWSPWAACSVTCGRGSRKRHRQVKQEAAAGGYPCYGPLQEVGACGSKQDNCGQVDCAWSQWSDWSMCSVSCGGGTRKRRRHVAVAPQHGGQLCRASIGAEAVPCNRAPCDDVCVHGKWAPWQDWSPCSATCSSSFRSRVREVAQESDGCGRPLQGQKEQYQVCSSLPPCIRERNCELSDWSTWSSCSCSCFGVRERNRVIQSEPTELGKFCDASLREVQPCNPGTVEGTPPGCQGLQKRDCAMTPWSVWSDCSRSCGGGQAERKRRVLSPGVNGGKTCSADTLLTKACGTQACGGEQCISCRWGQWSDWGACDGVCKAGQRTRHRSIEQMPNGCGQLCDMRSAVETANCTAPCGDAMACAWTEWASSGSCASCAGSLMRTRSLRLKDIAVGANVSFLFAGERVAQCSGMQLEKSACPLARCASLSCIPVPCSFSAWSTWSSSNCAGLCSRERIVATPNNECGKTCMGPLEETKACPSDCTQSTDCVVSNWHAWSSCDAPTSQKYRARTIVKPPERDGKPCPSALSQTIGCHHTPPKPCILSPWSEWSQCPQTCGGGARTRERRILQEATQGEKPCAASVKELQGCGSAPCIPGVVNCTLSAWGSWSVCDLGSRQQSRQRGIAIIEHHGASCEASLLETRPCSKAPADCVVSSWTEWDACDRSCGEDFGQQHRERQIYRFPDVGSGGKLCPASLVETRGCRPKCPADHDCQLGPWSPWGVCSAPCGSGQQERSRFVAVHRQRGGWPCKGALAEVRACTSSTQCPDRDCKLGDWGTWSACSRSCSGGIRGRRRKPMVVPRGGGRPCPPEDMDEVASCNTQTCVDDLCINGEWSDWTSWSPCSSSCRGGSTFRTRAVVVEATACGTPALGNDRETRLCNEELPCDDQDCVFSDWSESTTCSNACDGLRYRTRKILRIPRGDGKPCVGGLREVLPCGSRTACEYGGEPVDCDFGPWNQWSGCGASCHGYVNRRSRDIVTYSQHGGLACNGPLEETIPCPPARCPGPPPVDCRLGDWQSWGACTSICFGTRKRRRSVAQYPINGGKLCPPATTEEVETCANRCLYYCVWSGWSPWGTCTATCGAGRRMRKRSLALSDKPGEDPKVVGDAMEKYLALERAVDEMGPPSPQEYFVAFALGCFAYLGFFYIARRWPQRRRRQEQRSASTLSLAASVAAPLGDDEDVTDDAIDMR